MMEFLAWMLSGYFNSSPLLFFSSLFAFEWNSALLAFAGGFKFFVLYILFSSISFDSLIFSRAFGRGVFEGAGHDDDTI